LVTTGGEVDEVATDGTYAYWISMSAGGSVGKCAIANCATTATNLSTGLGGLSAIAVMPNEAKVLFGESGPSAQGGLWWTPTSGGAASAWGPNVGEVNAIWTTSTSFYYAAYDTGVYLSNAVGTFDAQVLSSKCTAGVTSDADNFYATDTCGGRLLVCPIGGNCTAPTVIPGIPGANRLFFDGSFRWMTGRGSSVNHFADGALYRCDQRSCLTFVTSNAGPEGVVSDLTNVYWTEGQSGAVMRSSVGAPTPVQVATLSVPVGIAQTDNALLIADQDSGRVYLLAK
jgi:hypothetical protein